MPQGWTVLRHEGDAKKVHQLEPEGKHHLEREIDLFDFEPPIHREVKPLFRNS